MLNILEGYDIGALGFGSPDTLHLLAEVLKIAFADRAAATADPAFVKVPVEKLLSTRPTPPIGAARIDLARAQSWSAEVAPGEGAHTTHLTVADGMGNIVASTQTINSLFGARYIVPGTGMIPNNYMFVFDPHPGRANSIAPGKRITSSMSPVIVLRDGKPRLRTGPAGRTAHLPLGDAGAVQPDRPRHERAGGGRGAAPLDAGLRRGGGEQRAVRRAGRRCATAATTWRRPAMSAAA